MCCGWTEGQVGEHAEIKGMDVRPCNHKHVMKQLFLKLDLQCIPKCAGFYGCQQNEHRSMVKRHMLELPPITSEKLFVYNRVYNKLVEYLRPKQLQPMTQQELIASTNNSKRELVRKAFDNLNANGWSSKFTKVSSFVKWEKAFDELDDPFEDKAPRLVQHREPEYCYELARFLKPVEHYVFGVKRGRFTNRPWVTKGMDSWQIGKRIAQMDKWSDTVWVLLDHSRFDSSLSAEMRASIEWRFYKLFYPNDSWLDYLVKQQRHNRGTTANGINYTVEGTMMSGEYNTSLGDSLINFGFLYDWMGPEADIVCNGDDSIGAMSYAHYKTLDHSYFDKVGLKTKIKVVHSIHDVDYCQCKPVRVQGRWRMVRDPWRVLSRSSYTCKSLDRKAWQSLAWAIGAGELSCNWGVPVLQAYALRIIECNPFCDLKWYKRYMEENRRMDSLHLTGLPISHESRLDFDLAFGISVQQQLELESIIEKAPLTELLST